MKKIFLFVWQLPQNLVALFILFILNRKNERYSKKIEKCTVWFVKRGVFKAGISLGNFIILDNLFDTSKVSSKYLSKTVKHEHGHQIQSIYTGPLYVLFIGIPSLCVNIYDRIYKKGSNWYYNQYPEKQADLLGDVHRWDDL